MSIITRMARDFVFYGYPGVWETEKINLLVEICLQDCRCN